MKNKLNLKPALSKLHVKFFLRSMLVLVLGVVTFETISFYKMSQMAQELSLENMKSSVRAASTRIDDELARLETDLQIIAGLPSLKSLFLSAGYGLESEANEYKKDLTTFFEKQHSRNNAYFGFKICDEKQQTLLSIFPQTYLSNQGAQSAQLSCQFNIQNERQYLPASEQFPYPVLVIRKNIDREGYALGQISLFFNLANYFSMVENYPLYESGFLLISDEQGTPISAITQDARELRAMINLSKSRGELSKKIPSFANSKGEKLLVYLSKLSNIDWTVAAFIYEEEIFAPLYTQLKIAVLVIFIMIITEAGLINLMTRQLITRRIKMLLSATRRMLNGEYQEKIPLQGNDEITELSEQFNQMTESLSEKIRDFQLEKEKVIKSENRLKGIIDNSSALINIKDREGVYQMVNNAFCEYFNKTQEQLIGKTDFDFFDKDLATSFRKNDELVLSTHSPIQFEEKAMNKHGKEETFITVKFPMVDDKGIIYATCGIATDITSRIEKEKALNEINEKLKLSNTLLESIEEGVVITDAEFNIIDLNPALVNLFGYSKKELLGEKPSIFRSSIHPQSFFDQLYSSLEQKGSWHGEIWESTKQGENIPQLLTVTSIKDESGLVTHYAGIYSDISDLKKTQSKLQKLAHYDSLTGLANRVLLEERTSQAILLAQREGYKVGMLFIDLDNFKYINDTLGHDIGDELLKQAARRFENVIRDTDTLARQGGDEFVILLSKTGHSNDAHVIAEKVREAGSQPFKILQHELYITTSIGIAVFPDDAKDTAGLLKCSDMAMYAAKDSGKNSFQFYSSELNHAAVDRLKIERSLRQAMDSDQLEVFYQPQIDAASSRIEKFEALLRWPQNDGHYIPPDLFIPIAEESGLIVKLGEWVIEKALVDIKALSKKVGRDFVISINLSARQFRHYELASRLRALASQYQFSPTLIEFEVTESLLVEDYKIAEKILNEIKNHGFRLALDDFGTGYSSMSYLKHFPLHTLKLDKVFMQDLSRDVRNQAIVSASVELGKALGLSIVCEGVETEEQFKFIQSLGGIKVQGYYYSKPLPINELTQLVANKQSAVPQSR